jgi:hypothetical protein
MPSHLAQAAGVAEHCPVGEEPPALFRDPVVTSLPCRHILFASFLQLPKKTPLLILLLHWGELQGGTSGGVDNKVSVVQVVPL